jgi:ribosomal protein L40E
MSSEQTAANHRLCTMCHTFLQYDATKCDSCKSDQYRRQCVSCGEFIPFGALQCKHCKTYQAWWRPGGLSHTTLALAIALIVSAAPWVKAISDFVFRHSKTAIVYQSVTAAEIRATVVNTGKSDSILRKYELVPGNDRILTRTELKLVSGESDSVVVIPAGGKVAIRLKPLTGMTRRVPYEGVLANLNDLNMTLRVQVEESNDDRIWRQDSFPARQIEVFILRHVPKAGRKEQR